MFPHSHWLKNFFVSTQLNDQTGLFQTIQFSMSTKLKWFQVLQCIPNNLIKHHKFIYTQLNVKTVNFKQFSLAWLQLFYLIHNLSLTQSRAATPGRSGPGSDGNKGILHILQSSNITEASPANCLVSYLGHSLVGSYPLCRDAISVFCSPQRTETSMACENLLKTSSFKIWFIYDLTRDNLL